MPERFFITTPIYYVNDKPHVGHAYTTIAADVLARYHRMKGEDVFYLTGTDENAQKNVESALKKYGSKKNDKTTREIVQQYVDEMSAAWQTTWDSLNISNDDFIRTTEERHIQFVEDVWKRVKEKGDIYKDVYEGLYCTGCEAYKTESELVNGLCPDHNRKPEKLSEENYFFRLSKYRDHLLKHIEENPEFIQPKERRNEVVAYIKDYAQDFSISRKNLEWGILVPGDTTQTIYVWFDALFNYISARPEWWPADLHLVGKDIIKFHCAYWPAMLMSADMALPRAVFAHGFFTVDGKKMSKTLGNVIDPVELSQKYGLDAMRYLLMAEISFGQDGDISFDRLNERYQSDLVNGLGNLTSRILTLASKQPINFDYSAAGEMAANMEKWWKDYHDQLDGLAIHDAVVILNQIMKFFDQYVDQNEPWKLAKDDPGRFQQVLSVLLEGLRHLAWMYQPFMPDTSEQILNWLGVYDAEKKLLLSQIQKWGNLKGTLGFPKGEALFPRFE